MLLVLPTIADLLPIENEQRIDFLDLALKC